MLKFRRKPDIMEAIQITNDNLEEAKAFLGDKFYGTWDWHPGRVGFLTINGSSAGCDPGDWILKDPYGRFLWLDNERMTQYFERVN